MENKCDGDDKKQSIVPKESLVEEYKSLRKKEEELDKELAILKSSVKDTDLKPQMKALHRYNEMKDLTQMVLGYLENIEKSTLSELHVRYNLPTD